VKEKVVIIILVSENTETSFIDIIKDKNVSHRQYMFTGDIAL
jgi:hypothetical protein